jgi:hypothetical protein
VQCAEQAVQGFALRELDHHLTGYPGSAAVSGKQADGAYRLVSEGLV